MQLVVTIHAMVSLVKECSVASVAVVYLANISNDQWPIVFL